MVVNRHDIGIAVDVDETLIHWDGTKMVPMQKNIDSLIRHSKRGHHITVWSAGGYAWAEWAVKFLGLEPYVDEVRCKFKWILDDKEPNEFLERYWYPHGPGKGVNTEVEGLVGSGKGFTPVLCKSASPVDSLHTEIKIEDNRSSGAV